MHTIRIILFYTFLALPLILFGQPGTLDPAFNGSGKVRFPDPSGNGGQEVFAVGVQKDGKIIMAGNSGDVEKPYAMITRVFPNGELDKDFGEGGIVYDPVSQFHTIKAIGFQSDSKIIIAGNIFINGYYDFVVIRLNDDGTVDKTFFEGGINKITFDKNSDDFVHALAIQDDDKIVIAGSTSNGSSDLDIAVVRLNKDGKIDNSFASDGLFTIPNETQMEEITAMVCGHWNKEGNDIYLTGRSRPDQLSVSDIYVLKLDSYGKPDLSFGEKGSITFPVIKSANHLPEAISYTEKEQIIIAGTIKPVGAIDDIFVVNLLDDGTLNKGFNETGSISIDASGAVDEAKSIAIQKNGHILVTGSSSKSYPLVVRVTMDGKPDENFGKGGIAILKEVENASINTCVLTHDERLIIAGSEKLSVPTFLGLKVNLKYEQTIEFPLLPSKTFGDPSFEIQATSGSGLPVTFSSSIPAVAAIDGNKITLNGAGMSLITAYCAGDEKYYPAEIARQLIVNKADQTISLSSNTKTYGDAPFSLPFVSSANLPVTYTSSNPAIASIAGNIVTIHAAGSISIIAKENGNNNYLPTQIERNLTINKASQLIAFNPLPERTFGEPAFTIEASSSSQLPIQFFSSDPSVAMVNNNIITLTGAGEVTIRAVQPGDNNYNSAEPVQQSFLVKPPYLFITGKKIVGTNRKEDYSLNYQIPNFHYNWSYSGKEVLFISDSTKGKISLFYTDKSTGGVLSCKIFNSSNNHLSTISQSITVNYDKKDALILNPINCDSLTVLTQPCTGSFVNYFLFNNLENTGSGCSNGYEDYTESDYTTEITLGDVYSAEIRVQKNPAFQGNVFYAAMWIDYNNNGSFDDAGEFITSSYGSDTIIQLNNLMIKNSEVYVGPRRLRISVQSSGEFTAADGCGRTGETGETEDYLISIEAPTKLQAPGVITPNQDGKNDYFVIRGIEPQLGSKLVIIDRTGEEKYSEKNYENTWAATDNNGSLLPRGTYYYIFSNGPNTIKGFFEILY